MISFFVEDRFMSRFDKGMVEQERVHNRSYTKYTATSSRYSLPFFVNVPNRHLLKINDDAKKAWPI